MAGVSIGPLRLPPEGRESGRALPNFTLALAVVALTLGLLLTAVTVYAIFTDSDSVTPNDFASDTLDPATILTAPVSGSDVNLSWTATVDTYATGHRVLRGTASGGPYSQIAEVTPRTTTTYTDSPADGTYYYVLRAFYQNWESVNGNEASATVGAGCTAGDTGFLNATAEVADTGGDGDGFESNPTGAFADAGGIASNINGAGDRHRYFDYGFSVPASCSIRGIEVRVDWWLDNPGGSNTMDVELSWDGGTTWTATKTDTQETTSEHTVILGSSVDRWGRIWALADLNDANFRLRLASNGSNARDFFLDWVPVKVYYDVPPSGIDRVQKTTAASAGNASSITATYGAAPTQDNLLVLVHHYTTTGTVTLPAGWTQAVLQVGTGKFTIAYKIAGAAEGTGVTVSVGFADDQTLSIFEYSGIDTVSPLDQTASNLCSTATTSCSTGTTATTSVADELLIAGLATMGASGGWADTWTNGFTQQSTVESTGGGAGGHSASSTAEVIVSATGTFETTEGWTTTRSAQGVIATFKAAP